MSLLYLFSSLNLVGKRVGLNASYCDKTGEFNDEKTRVLGVSYVNLDRVCHTEQKIDVFVQSPLSCIILYHYLVRTHVHTRSSPPGRAQASHTPSASRTRDPSDHIQVYHR